METTPVYNMEGIQVGTFELDPEVFDGKVHKGVLAQTLLAHLANQRSGTAATKTRGEVAGGGKKPWRQKGTGRARAGSIRSPLWRKGGIVFGPHPRDYSYSLPKKIKKLALKSILNDRVLGGRCRILNEWNLDEAKTKKVNALLRALSLQEKVLIVLGDEGVPVERAARNVEQVTLSTVQGLNAYEVLRSEYLILSKKALEQLTLRLRLTPMMNETNPVLTQRLS